MSLIGIPIGFYGYVFPGNINLMVLELYTSKRYKFLMLMLSLIIIFESIYCVVSLIFLNSIRNNLKFFAIIESTSYTLILVMGLWMLLERKGQKSKSIFIRCSRISPSLATLTEKSRQLFTSSKSSSLSL